MVIGLICLIAASAFAQPVVDLVEGAWADDEVITVYGSGFGRKSPAPPVLWDTVNNQEAYSRLGISHGDVVPVKDDGCEDCPWTAQIPSDWGNPIYYWTQDTRVPGEDIYHFTTKGYFRFHDLGEETPAVMYVNWWFRTSREITAGSNKLIRNWHDTTGDYRTSWTTMHLTANADYDHDGEVDEVINDWGDWEGVTGQWNNLELTTDGRGDIQNGYGRIIAKTNNELIHDVNNISENPLNNIYVLGLDASVSDNTRDFEFDLANIYIDNTMARVIVGNEPGIPTSLTARSRFP